MTAVTLPARSWGDDQLEPAPAPTVLVSSRDGAPIPTIRGLAGLVKRIESTGMGVRLTYARAAVPSRHYANGRVAEPAHELASVVIRVDTAGAHPWLAGWAAWHNKDGEGWRFAHGYVGSTRVGARSLAAALEAVR